MSSLTRRIQRGGDKPQNFHSKGSKMGIPANEQAKDLLARLAREAKRVAR